MSYEYGEDNLVEQATADVFKELGGKWKLHGRMRHLVNRLRT